MSEITTEKKVRVIRLPYKNIVTKDYLRDNPDIIFVYGDNVIRRGTGGGAALRNHPQTYGFITKKYPDYRDTSYYTPEEYTEIYNQEIKTLIWHIKAQPKKIFLISKLGAGLANKFGIYEKVIAPRIEADLNFENVVFL